MHVLYLILLTVSLILLLLDAFTQTTDGATHRHRVGVRLLPLALFFYVLVAWIHVVKTF